MACHDEAIEVQPEFALDDLALFSAASDEIRKIMKEVSQLKTKTPEKWKEAAQELRIEGSFHFLTLKKLNRIAQIRCKNAKDATMEAKQKLDGNNLRLQNLQYEISHLDKEINSCLQFKSRHEEIDLVPVNEFYAEAPSEITKEAATRNDEHMQMLSRLDWELENRKSLNEELKQTHLRKEESCGGIKKRKQDLDGLRPSLETVLKSTMPLQEALGDHFTETRALHDNAYLLPQPLYVLFIQAKAFSGACDHNMEVQIGGDLNTALKNKTFESQKVMDATSLYKNHEEEESDSEIEDDQENQRQRRKSTSANVTSSSEPTLFTPMAPKHPLYVSLKIYLESKVENSPYLLLRFYYYSETEFVTVVPLLELSSAYNDVKSSPLTSPRTLLHDLQEEDKGRNLSSDAQNRSTKDARDFSLLRESEFAYLWVQKLTGLDALEDSGASKTQSSFSNMHLIVKLIRHRIASRLSLANLLHQFERNIVTCDSTIMEKFAPSVLFKLSSWKAIDFETYSGLEYTKPVLDLGLVSANDYLFLATLRRGTSAKVVIAVALSGQYPKQRPLFRVQLHWRGDYTAENNLNLREIEVEVNCRMPEAVPKKFQNEVLSAQMYRLLTLLDIYVETDCNMDGSDMPSEFPTTTLCPRMAKGKARLKPLKFNSKYRLQCY